MELEHTGSNKDNKLNVGNPNCGSDELAVRQHSACNAIKNKEGSNFAAKDMRERSVQNDTAGGGEQQHSMVFSDRSDSGKKGHLSSQNSCESKNCANQVLLAEMPAEGVNSTHDIKKDKDASNNQRDKAIDELYEYFAEWNNEKGTDIFYEFDFKKFAEINGIEVDKKYIPHSANVKRNFKRIHDVAYKLLKDGLTIGKENRVDGENGKPKSTPITDGDVTIKLTPEEVLDACKRVEEYALSNEAKKYINDNELKDLEYQSYKLYGELGNIILGKLNTFVQEKSFDKIRETMKKMGRLDESLYCQILSLPLLNYTDGMELCTKLFDLVKSIYIRQDNIEIVDPKTGCVNNAAEFRKLGIFFACKNQTLTDEILEAAKFATSVGMKMPLFMAEFSGKQDKKTTLGMSYEKAGIILNVSTISKQPRTLKSKYGSELDIEIEESHRTFYHEITHHARSTEWVMDNDTLIAGKNLKDEVLKFRDDVIKNIENQISEYALTDYEEYIAEFAAVVLCCLQKGENPFNYITNKALWRLYYEFGGPDFAPIIKKRKFLPSGYGKDCDILSNKECDWCSGYPSKFGIDLNKCSDKKIKFSSYTSKLGKIYIGEKTILPPPPLGYCYTTDNKKLQLKVDKSKLSDSEDNEYYTPRFVKLTDGPLTLYDVSEGSLQQLQILEHHFELLPVSNNYAIYKLKNYFKELDNKNKDFKFNKFDFKKFAEINGIKVDEKYIPHSVNVENSFKRIHDVAYKLLEIGLTIGKKKRVNGENGKPKSTPITDGDVTIKLTPEDVLDACKRVDEYASSDEAKKYINDNGLKDLEYQPYKLYGELGNIILGKLNTFVQKEYFDKNTEAMMTMRRFNERLYRQILSLPLPNYAEGMELCTKIFDLMIHRYNDKIKIVSPKTDCVNNAAEFRKLGIFFAYKSKKLAGEILEAAKFATSVGMKMPLFMAEISSEEGYAHNWMNLALEQAGILLNVRNKSEHYDNVINKLSEPEHILKSKYGSKFDIKTEDARYRFYRGITHHARIAVGIRNSDISIKDKKLKDKELRIPSNIKSEIESRFSEYALTNYEEYIAEFAAVVLCCLQNGRNPFQVITDTKLWRLYYEFGGPDFAPIIKEKGFLPSGYNKKCDILLNKECDWCSGYPSKFNIDVNNLSDKNVFVADGSSTIVYRLVPITSKTILPPPPIGYRYTTRHGSIELKRKIKLLEPDGKYYTPNFCSLTNGPLSFVSATDSSDPESEVLLPHHFELLK